MDSNDPYERFHLRAIIIGVLAILFIVMFALVSHAQVGGFVYSPRESSRPHGEFIVAWNATGTEIPDGTLVMSDTTGATSAPQVAIGKGFKTWTHSTTAGDAARILGLTMGNTPGYSQGRVLVLGFHPWAKIDATGIAAFTRLTPSLLTTTNGALRAFAAADSTANVQRKPVIGIFQRYANPDSLRGYVWINTLGVMGR